MAHIPNGEEDEELTGDEAKRKRSAKARTSRRKGHDLEREVVREMKGSCCRPPGGNHDWQEPERVLEYARGKGVDAKCAHFLAQCKRGNHGPIPRLFAELLDATSTEPGIPILVTKRDREPCLVTIEADHFWKLLR